MPKATVTFKGTCNHCAQFVLVIGGDDPFPCDGEVKRVLKHGTYRVQYVVKGEPKSTLTLEVKGAQLNGSSTITTDDEGWATGRRTLRVPA